MLKLSKENINLIIYYVEKYSIWKGSKSERKSNWQYLFIKENRLKGNGFSSRFVP